MFWTRAVAFPKWGVITTSRVVEDIIILLKERGIDDITIGEGSVSMYRKGTETAAHAFETLGYGLLKQKYGIKYINVFERPFEKVDLGDGVELNFNTDILSSEFVVDLPVMKAHNRKRPHDLCDIEILGENIENVSQFHEYDFKYSDTEDGIMPLALAKEGLKGVLT